MSKKPITNDDAQVWLANHELSVSRNPKGVVSLRSKEVEGALGVGPTLRHAVLDAFKKSPATLDNGDSAGVLFMAAALDGGGEDLVETIGEIWFPEETGDDSEEDDEEDTEDEDSEDEDSEDDDSEEEEEKPVRFAKR